MPASFSHTLRSTVQRCGPTIDCCESSLTTPGGSGQAWNLRVFLSNFTIPDWNMCESHRLPSASTSRSSVPLGKFGRCSGIGNSVYFKLAGSKRPRNCSSNCENQTMPSPSTMTSCGINGFLGSSYSVMTARVLLPLTRGSGWSGYDHGQQLGGQGVQVDLLAQPGTEYLDGPAGVVTASVEAPVDRPLDVAAGRLERRGHRDDHRQQRHHDRGQRHPLQLLPFDAAGAAEAHHQRGGGHHEGDDGDGEGCLVGDQ